MRNEEVKRKIEAANETKKEEKKNGRMKQNAEALKPLKYNDTTDAMAHTIIHSVGSVFIFTLCASCSVLRASCCAKKNSDGICIQYRIIL